MILIDFVRAGERITVEHEPTKRLAYVVYVEGERHYAAGTLTKAAVWAIDTYPHLPPEEYEP